MSGDVSEWQRITLGEACKVLTDGDWIETKDQGGQDYRLLQVSNIGVGRFVETGKFRYVTRDTFRRLRCTEVIPGMVLVSRMPTPIGRAWYVDRLDEPSITAVDVAILDPDPAVLDGRFCAYALNDPDRLAHWEAASSGTTRARITRRQLSEHKLVVPPPAEQRSIARVLGAIDDLIEGNRRRVALLEQMARSIYREWFVNFRYPGHEADKLVDSPLGLIPAGWETSDVGTETLNFDRLRKPLSRQERSARPGGFPYYGAARVIDSIDGYLFDGDYLLVAEDGSVITEGGFPILQRVRGQFWVSNHAHVLQGARRVTTTFLELALTNYPIIGHVTGAAQPKVTQANLNRIDLLVPPNEVMNAFSSAVEPAVDAQLVLAETCRVLEQTRDLLLPRLVTGAVDVSHLDLDELLEEPAP